MLIRVAFFDLGKTLADPIWTGNPPELEAISVYRGVPIILEHLAKRRIKLGIISNTGDIDGYAINLLLKKASIFSYFDPSLLIYSGDVGYTKADPAIFTLAVGRVGEDIDAEQCLYVGEDPAERAVALSAGLQVADSPAAADELVP